MAIHKVGYLIGSLARESINRKLAKALVQLAPPELEMTEIAFRDLPLAQATAAMNAAIDRRARPRGGHVDLDLTATWMQRVAAALAADGARAGDSFDAFCRRHPQLLRRRDRKAA